MSAIRLLLPALIFFTGILCSSPVAAKDASLYLGRINEKQQAVNNEAMGYVSAVAHGKSARKIDKQRSELISAVSQARAMAKNMEDFEGDTALKAAAYEYFNLNYIVFKEDYGKIMDLEELSEQSYDGMEAYLAAQDIANKKLEEANDKMQTEFRAFAARHDVKLVEEETKMSKMTEQVNKTNAYYHSVFLLFFKSYHTELYLVQALDKKDVNGIEQNKNSLVKSTQEDLAKLAKVGGFEGDENVVNACRALLLFYQTEAKNKIQVLTDFVMQQENFDKIKKATEAKSNRTQQDVDAYNKAAGDINKAAALYNKTNKELNEGRGKLLNDWNNAVETFLSKHTPRYNK